ncbi:MAG: hypothetical protein IKH35_07875 [Prevotella sp.]|jgi:hypothetical protein|nr:hypothetical protein [Prevotella sp.]MBR6275985.1 hypothetical protein [Prevotella sp.]
MKKKGLIISLLLLVSLMTYAQNAVAVYQQDGTVAKFGFSEKPVVTYVGDNLVLTTTKTTVEYPIYQLKKISFDVEDVADAIPVVKADVQFSFHGETLTISGDEPYSHVYIYNLKGMAVGHYQLDGQGNTTINVSGLSRNLYVVKAKSFTFKFRKS